MARSGRSVPNPEMAFVPALIFMTGLVTLLAVAGYSLMKPTVLRNPGVAAYQPPAAKVMDYGGEARVAAVERAANEAAKAENDKLRSTVAAGTTATEVADRPVAAPPKEKTARVQKRPDAPAPSQPRVAQPEPAAQSAFAQRRFGIF